MELLLQYNSEHVRLLKTLFQFFSDGRMKPDITAPGDAIVSSIPDVANVINNADGKIAQSIENKTYYWAFMSGTSMAAPFVTGVLATWLEANPQLTPEKVREVFSTTAMTDTYTGTCPNNTWGYGKLDAYEGLLKVIATTPIQNLEKMPDAIMLYPNPNNGSFKLLFTESDENLLVTVYTANGQQVLTRQIDHVNTQEDISVDLGTITSGAYTTYARYTGSYVNSIASFSSKGPTADGRMKPDITAPGNAIVSSIPDITSVTNYADGKTSETIGDKTYYWAYMSGTSMASPFVTGVLATWLEANPQLTPEKVREVLSTTAMTDNYTGTCPNNTWGYGKLDAYEGLLKVIATTPIQNLEKMPDAIMLYPNPNNGSFKFLLS